ncbi:CDP-alcohol phosphatidyltransferase family protein [Candidatus Micrarchaeota archaeon]|nr:CDP-alcohol phosphatidyltransferase family protein [Candidatus Micrarchaeota archaeon]
MKAQSIRKKVKPLSQKIGIFFGRFGSPNAYTCLTLVFGLLAAYSIAIGEIGGALVALVLSAFFDWVDGAVARVQKKATKFGIVFDSIVDKITETAIYLGFAWFAVSLYWPAVLALTTFLISSFISKVAYEIQVNAQGGLAERRERFVLLLIALLLIPFSLDLSGIVLYLMAVLSGVTAFQRFLWIKKQAK